MAAPSISPPAAAPARGRVSLPPFPAAELVVPMIILVALFGAEWLTIVTPSNGLVGHTLLLMVLVFMGAATRDSAKRELYWTLVLAPVIRIGSLTLPLGRLPLIWWYPLIGVPIFSAAFVTARKLRYSNRQIGLTLPVDSLPAQLALIPFGSILGIGEYLIFRPAPLVESFSVGSIFLPAVVLTIFTGFEEELIFRGLMQRAALRSVGRWGLVYVNLVFAVLHVGYLSVLDVIFVFLVGFLFSLFVLRTKSLLGVTLAHGAINISLFLIIPFLAPMVLGTGVADLMTLPLPPANLPPH